MRPPAYFEAIRQRADNRWRQLEADRELAGPWHQLFKQVQYPRVVLSELLQNADDAGARRATVRFEDGVFIFEHDGADFTEDQFASLCRFGFSNKRSLHTIGFRGIGFKSTFSLGDTVEVLTPSLAVRFHRQRFTEPQWIDGAQRADSTIVRVKVADKNRGNQLRGSLSEWTESPSSLLFFKNLRCLSIDGAEVSKRVTKRGPVERSQFLNLTGEGTERLFLVQSEAEALPEDAAEEVRGERGLTDLEDLHLPPCEIEIVLGLGDPQRLYVVLPTGAEVPVPFSINGPFIQDPARMKIKDPATSPTNRWLLERAGRLLAQTLIGWIGNKDLTLAERARAYELLSPSTDFDSSLGGQCAQIIFEAFDEAVEDHRLVLTTSGTVALPGEAVAVPAGLHDVWEPSPLRDIFGDEEHRHVVASEVVSASVEALANRDWIVARDASDVISRLQQDDEIPRPRGWEHLQKLWEFIAAQRSWDYYTDTLRELRLVPVQGDKVLHPADETIRLSSKRDQLTDPDWEFLLANTRSIAPDWIAWIAKLQPTSEGSSRQRIPAAARLLQQLSLHEPTPVDRVVSQAFARLIAPGEAQIADCVRMAHIMAALSAKIPEGFQFVTRDRHLRKTDHGIVWDETGEVEQLVSEEWLNEHFLHETYEAQFVSCTREQWKAWAASAASGLHLSIPVESSYEHPGWRSSVERIAIERGGRKPTEYHYKRDSFRLNDFDFPEEVVEAVSERDDAIEVWCKLLEGVLGGPVHQWKEKLEATIRHEGNQYSQLLNCGSLCAKWIHRFRSLACLSDTFGKLHIPADLLLRTPDTEPLMGIELFVHADLDIPANRPLLGALGVRENPADPHKILDRLRGLSRGLDPARVITEIARLYEALDRVVARMAPAQLTQVADIFAGEALILADNQEWLSTGEVSVFGDPDTAAPGIHPSVQRLAMWPRLNVPERPAVEKTIEWLQSVPTGKKLDTAELKRVRFALQRDPVRIWHACGHWLTLDNTWASVSHLKFRLTMQELIRWSDLSPSVKTATANFQMLGEETTQLDPFIGLRSLADAVQLRVTRCDGGESCSMPGWLDELASSLCRVRFGSEEETQRIRAVAQRLLASRWRRFTTIDVTPYVDSDPAGEATSPKAFWSGDQVFAASLPMARLHKDLADEISRPFAQNAIAAAVAACIERAPEFVREYLENAFTLDAQMDLPETKSAKGDDHASQPPESEHEKPTDASPEPDQTDDVPSGDNAEDESTPETEEEEDAEPKPRRPKPSAPHEPTLIEQYAKKHGFQKNGDGSFIHRDGRQIVKAEQPFQWAEQRGGHGLIRRLWLCEQSLSAGIEVSHELWQTIKRNPDNSVVVSLGEDGEVLALTGTQLNERKNAGHVAIFPASYRLITANNNSRTPLPIPLT